ncbi:MAG: SDR family NAD(P)-dependent oxidoreductase [Fusobacteriaceae bacterium]
MKLKQKVAIVTGASSGIGMGIAEKFLNEGAKVIGCGIEKECALSNENFVYVQADLRNYEDAEKVANKGLEVFKELHILVNCAGVTGVGTLETTDLNEFSRQFEINVNGVFNMCKASIGELKKHKSASIINISSDLGVKPIPQRVAYCPSKAAVIMLTKCIAVDHAPNVRANTIMPGLVETPMIASRFESEENAEQFRKQMSELYLLKRIGTIEDMANSALFLASDDSSFITGSDLAVCGGGHIK